MISDNFLFKKQTSSTIEILKWTAIILMVIDHAGMMIFPSHEWMRGVGRLSFPLFSYILAHNYRFFSSNKKEYIARLFIVGMIAEPFLFLLPYHAPLNVFFNLGISLFVLYLIEEIKILKKRKLTFILVISVLFYLSLFVDYGVWGILMTILLYFSFSKQYLFLFVLLFTMISENSFEDERMMVYALLSYPFIILISYFNFSKVKRTSKIFFYLFYPVHIFLLFLFTL